MKKQERRIVFFIGVVALLVFTFTDLQISQAVCHKQLPARVLEVIGEIPFMVMTLSGCAMLIRFRTKEKKTAEMWRIIWAGSLFVLFSAMGGFMIYNYLSRNVDGVPKFFALVLGIIMAFLGAWIAAKVPADRKRQAVSFAVTALIYFVLVIILMNSLKTVWGRMRFREMTDPLTQFTPWYQISSRGGFSDVYASFPSGHSMNSAAVILLLLFPGFFPQLAGKKKILRGIVYVWIVLVGSSRVMMGAHFASDVTVGILLSLALFEVIRTIVFKVRKEQFR
ncbi:MAG: phosphatase PAP2 family protein [Lachnospiraceae bacterium]